MSTRLKLLSRIAMSAALALFLFGCDEEISNDDSSISDEEALTEMFLDDTDLEAPDVWQDGSDGGDVTAAELRALDDPIEPIAWWRIGYRAGTSVSVEFQDDDHATITRVRRFEGDFRLLTELTDSTMETIDKPMFNELVRKAHAVRIADTPYPRRNWRVVEITPEVMRSVEPNPNTVNLLSLTVTDEFGDLIVEVDDPLHTYFDREALPLVYAGETVNVYVETEGAIPGPVGMLRPNVHRGGRLPRLPLHDDGIAPDEVAEDGIYSGAYQVGHRLGLHHVGLDFIDFATIYDDEAPYDATGWGVPYRIVAN